METTSSEIESFHRFIGNQLKNGGAAMTAEQALRAFHAHQADVERLKRHVGKSEGDPGKPLDSDALKQRVKDRLARHGVSE